MNPARKYRLSEGHAPARGDFPWPKRLAWLPLFVLAVPAVIVALIVRQDLRSVAELNDRFHREHRLRMESCLDHVQEYFDAVYSTLYFISLDEEVMGLRRDSKAYIQKVYDHQWEHHQLAEVYVVERGFTGDRPPFMAFERASQGLVQEHIHSLSREHEEYKAQIDRVQRFAVDSNAPALRSREIRLCVPDAHGGLARGYVYSVPIHSNQGLAGIVAGMIKTDTILEVLQRGQDEHVAFLVNARGNLIGAPESASAAAAQFRQ
jgi:hypothetical protein